MLLRSPSSKQNCNPPRNCSFTKQCPIIYVRIGWRSTERSKRYGDWFSLAINTLTEPRPWVLAKDPADSKRLQTVLFHAAETLRFLCVATYPFMPETAREVARQLGLPHDVSQMLLASPIAWGDGGAEAVVAKGKALFPRIDASTFLRQGDSMKTDQSTAPISINVGSGVHGNAPH